MMKVVQINPKEAKSLIDELDEYQASLYPAESNHLDSLEVLCNENVTMFGVKEQNQIIAIGAVKMFDNYGEIKRVYVPKRHRNKGLAETIMAVLENSLLKQSVKVAKLETGIYQHEAIGLYRKLGYQDCKAFGSYQPDPLSLFMTKKL
mgnify:CR=1 FL=1